MAKRNKRGFGSFLGTLILLALLLAIAFVGYKTYEKLPVVTFIGEFAGAVSELDLNRLSEYFTPDSDVKKALDLANTIGNMPILGELAGSAAGLISGSFDYEVDYTDVKITVNGQSATAVFGVIDKKNAGRKSYLTLNLEKIDDRWYTPELPSIKPASETDLEYNNTIQGYAEHASDYAAFAIYAATNQ
ncbi:MAG: hypothetical protein LBS84_11220 [Clostridiales bacterium]|jgi:hypothetical protein|nr:hypothetical protein [Clostridiales bacterium]